MSKLHKSQPPLPANCPKIGEVWQHWKGATYTITSLAVMEASPGTVEVLYISKEGQALGFLPWSRPLRHAANAFLGMVPAKDLRRHGRRDWQTAKVPRFTRIAQAGKIVDQKPSSPGTTTAEHEPA